MPIFDKPAKINREKKRDSLKIILDFFTRISYLVFASGERTPNKPNLTTP